MIKKPRVVYIETFDQGATKRGPVTVYTIKEHEACASHRGSVQYIHNYVFCKSHRPCTMYINILENDETLILSTIYYYSKKITLFSEAYF